MIFHLRELFQGERVFPSIAPLSPKCFAKYIQEEGVYSLHQCPPALSLLSFFFFRSKTILVSMTRAEEASRAPAPISKHVRTPGDVSSRITFPVSEFRTGYGTYLLSITSLVHLSSCVPHVSCFQLASPRAHLPPLFLLDQCYCSLSA